MLHENVYNTFDALSQYECLFKDEVTCSNTNNRNGILDISVNKRQTIGGGRPFW